MFGATKAFALIGILALSGALLLQTAADPAVDDERMGAEGFGPGLGPATVEGTVVGGEWPDAGSEALGNDMYEWVSPPAVATWESSDQRLSGDGSFIEHGLQHFTSYTGLRTSDWTIENDGGSWRGTGNAYSSADGGRDFVMLTGSGAYEGLSAYIAIGPGDTVDGEVDSRAFEGVIFPGAPPSDPTP